MEMHVFHISSFVYAAHSSVFQALDRVGVLCSTRFFTMRSNKASRFSGLIPESSNCLVTLIEQGTGLSFRQSQTAVVISWLV